MRGSVILSTKHHNSDATEDAFFTAVWRSENREEDPDLPQPPERTAMQGVSNGLSGYR